MVIPDADRNTSPIDIRIDDWEGEKNLEYIDYTALDNMLGKWYIGNMFDVLIYRILDKVETTCKKIREYMINKSLPSPCKSASEWRKDYEKWKENSTK